VCPYCLAKQGHKQQATGKLIGVLMILTRVPSELSYLFQLQPGITQFISFPDIFGVFLVTYGNSNFYVVVLMRLMSYFEHMYSGTEACMRSPGSLAQTALGVVDAPCLGAVAADRERAYQEQHLAPLLGRHRVDLGVRCPELGGLLGLQDVFQFQVCICRLGVWASSLPCSAGFVSSKGPADKAT
jgi:hypothetical protein